MIITYHGKQFFKVQHGETVIAINPISKDAPGVKKTTKFGSDICLVSLNLPEYNGVENATYSGKEPFVITGPGEYEIGDLYIRGFLSRVKVDGEEHINTIYTFSIDNMTLWFLGALGHVDLDKELLEQIEEVDILFASINEDAGFGPVDVQKATKLFSPKAIVPMDYDEKGKTLDAFLKEFGKEGIKAEDKITLKQKDLEGKNNEILLLYQS